MEEARQKFSQDLAKTGRMEEALEEKNNSKL